MITSKQIGHGWCGRVETMCQTYIEFTELQKAVEEASKLIYPAVTMEEDYGGGFLLIVYGWVKLSDEDAQRLEEQDRANRAQAKLSRKAMLESLKREFEAEG